MRWLKNYHLMVLNGLNWKSVQLNLLKIIYLLEVDTEYPKHLHKAHEDLPFLPERRKPLDKPFKHEVNNDIKKAHNKVFKHFNITH